MKNYTGNTGVTPNPAMFANDMTSWDGTIEVNAYPYAEFRIWICVQCTNDF